VVNVVYPKWKEAVIQGGANSSLAGNVKAVLVDLADYTYGAAHEFLTDLPVAARVDITANLTGKTYADGVFNSDDVVFAAAAGDQSEAVMLFIDTGADATSRLVAYYDTGVGGLPVTPNTGDINATVNASGWFAF
jgi:hypothetical protein